MSVNRKKLEGDPCCICGEPFYEEWSYNAQCMVTDRVIIIPPNKGAHSDCIDNDRLWRRLRELENKFINKAVKG